MRAPPLHLATIFLLTTAPMMGCSPSSSSSSNELEVRGIYETTSPGTISTAIFEDATHYSLRVSSPCPAGESHCFQYGTYVLHGSTVSLTNADTGETTVWPFEATSTEAPNNSLATQSLHVLGGSSLTGGADATLDAGTVDATLGGGQGGGVSLTGGDAGALTSGQGVQLVLGFNLNGQNFVASASDAGAPDAGSLSCPTGYTLTPYLTKIATTHTFAKADQVIDNAKTYAAVVDTDQGAITLELYASQTPITCNSFVFLALNHYFDGIAFHRVVDGYVAQGGDPNTLNSDRSTWGNGTPGYLFGLELVKAFNYDTAGVVGMARTADPNTNGSQFFITLADAGKLDPLGYTIFAKVSDGMSVLPDLARDNPPTSNNPPTIPSRMIDVHICEKM